MQNFVKIGQTAIFRFSRWPPFAILDFGICTFLVSYQVGGPRWIIVTNFIKIGRTAAEITHFNIFQDGGRPPFCICWANFGMTHIENLVAFTLCKIWLQSHQSF